MENREVRRLLWQWADTVDWIRRKTEEQKALHLWADDVADTLKAQRLTGMPKGGPPRDMADIVAELERRLEIAVQEENAATQEIEERLRFKRAIDDLVEEKLTPVEQKILHMRYHDRHAWQYIAIKLSYDVNRVKHKEAEAVRRLGHYMDAKKLD